MHTRRRLGRDLWKTTALAVTVLTLVQLVYFLRVTTQKPTAAARERAQSLAIPDTPKPSNPIEPQPIVLQSNGAQPSGTQAPQQQQQQQQGKIQQGPSASLGQIPGEIEHPACVRLRDPAHPVEYRGALLFFCPVLARTEELVEEGKERPVPVSSVEKGPSIGDASVQKVSVMKNAQVPVVPWERRQTIWQTASEMIEGGNANELLVEMLGKAWPVDNGLWKQKRSYGGTTHFHLWCPRADEGGPFVIHECEHGCYRVGVDGPLKENDVMIDIGSNLGTIMILQGLSSPVAKIVGVEASPYTWLFQQINLYSNLGVARMVAGGIFPILAGMSNKDGGRLHMQFRDGSTSSTRSWNPSEEDFRTHSIISVPTISWGTLLQRTVGDSLPEIRMLKLDCEGCEYDLIPSLSQEWLNKIRDIQGELHAGAMARFNGGINAPPRDKLLVTHKFVCPFMFPGPEHAKEEAECEIH